jgi:superfamily II DNA or RNA helicase
MNIHKNIKTKLTSNGYHVTISTISKELLAKTIDELTPTPYRLDASEKDLQKARFPVYKYSNDRLELIVPRYYGISKFGPPKETYFNPTDVEFNFTQELRDLQRNVVDRCIEYMRKQGGGLLAVPCGFGKTVCALYIAHRLGLKTLILVHKSFLIGQWVDRIKEFLGLTNDDIGIIRRKVCDVKDKKIVVGIFQTTSKHNYDPSVFDKFGLVIYDEAHHVACKFFSKTLLKTGAQYTLALTATPYRGDGLIKIMYWFAGGTIYREKLKMNKNVVVKIINHTSTDKLFAIKQSYMLGKLRVDTGKMTTNICDIDTRNNKIIEMITHIRRTQPERKILILSERLEHLKVLKTGVDAAITEDIIADKLDPDDIFSCYYIGPTKPLARQEAEERGDIIFATYGMAHEGLDIKHLNTVILATNKKDVLQSIGRIMRRILKSGDVRPLIIDIADNLPAINRWLDVRKIIYNKSKYEIDNYFLYNDKFCTYLQYNDPNSKDTGEKMHHENCFINRAINDYNIDMISLKHDIIRFTSLCKKMNEHLGLPDPDPDIDTNHSYNYLIEDNVTEYKVYEDMEFTNMRDIFFVPKLTDEDLDREVVKNVDENAKIDLDKDMSYDLEDEETNMKKIILIMF